MIGMEYVLVVPTFKEERGDIAHPLVEGEAIPDLE